MMHIAVGTILILESIIYNDPSFYDDDICVYVVTEIKDGSAILLCLNGGYNTWESIRRIEDDLNDTQLGWEFPNETYPQWKLLC